MAIKELNANFEEASNSLKKLGESINNINFNESLKKGKPFIGISSEDLDTIIGVNIRKIRLVKGYSQQDIAAPLGVTFQQIQKYEKGTNRIAASKLYILADFLGVPTDNFRKVAQ